MKLNVIALSIGLMLATGCQSSGGDAGEPDTVIGGKAGCISYETNGSIKVPLLEDLFSWHFDVKGVRDKAECPKADEND